MSPCYEFIADDADIIIISHPDRTEFRLHKCILSAASTFFRDMFSLPQPLVLPESELPIIPVTESQTTLDLLLRFVYPIHDPIITNLDDLSSVLAAAVKYDFEAVCTTLRKQLVLPHFVLEEP